jgi:hypothetical protein
MEGDSFDVSEEGEFELVVSTEFGRPKCVCLWGY